MKLKFDIYFILVAGLAITFLSMSLKAFFSSDELVQAINGSVIFNHLLNLFPYLITIIGVHDLVVCFLLLLQIKPKIIAPYATFWLSVVTILYLTHLDIDGLLDALEHASPLVIALFLALLAYRKQSSPLGNSTQAPAVQTPVLNPSVSQPTAVVNPLAQPAQVNQPLTSYTSLNQISNN